MTNVIKDRLSRSDLALEGLFVVCSLAVVALAACSQPSPSETPSLPSESRSAATLTPTPVPTNTPTPTPRQQPRPRLLPSQQTLPRLRLSAEMSPAEVYERVSPSVVPSPTRAPTDVPTPTPSAIPMALSSLGGFTNGRWLERQDPQLASAIKNLGWVRDSIDDRESEVIQDLLYIAVTSRSVVASIVSLGWVQDGIHDVEAGAFRWLDNMGSAEVASSVVSTRLGRGRYRGDRGQGN